jgi:hypothetical protein
VAYCVAEIAGHSPNVSRIRCLRTDCELEQTIGLQKCIFLRIGTTTGPEPVAGLTSFHSVVVNIPHVFVGDPGFISSH